MISFSQVGQDKLVQSLSSVPGVFIDLAANHPYENSNTASLELLGWKGLCIDPTLRSKHLFETSNRSCTFVNEVVGANCNTTVLFRDISPFRKTRHAWMFGLSGVVTNERSKTCWGNGFCISPREMHRRGLKVEHRNLTVNTLDSILRRYAIEHVDYLSLDVEGFEFHVLSGYSKSPRLLSIEKPDDRCRQILTQRKMKLMKSLGNFGEEFWVK